jgi:hypothetical protein
MGSWHNSMRGFERSGARAVGGDRGRLQPAAQTSGAGAASRLPRQIGTRRRRWRKRIGVSRPTVWRWQQRFAESGVEGLLRDKTRKPGKGPIAAETTARVVALTPAFARAGFAAAPPHQATHWTGRAMAKAIGISLGSGQRICWA